MYVYLSGAGCERPTDLSLLPPHGSPPVLHAGLAFVNINIFVSVKSQVDKNIAAISFIFWQLGKSHDEVISCCCRRRRTGWYPASTARRHGRAWSGWRRGRLGSGRPCLDGVGTSCRRDCNCCCTVTCRWRVRASRSHLLVWAGADGTCSTATPSTTVSLPRRLPGLRFCVGWVWLWASAAAATTTLSSPRPPRRLRRALAFSAGYYCI